MFAKLRPHLLSIFFGAIFLIALGGQSIAGLAMFNEDQVAHGLTEVSYGAFITSSDFVVDVAENWQSEFLQFFLFILATVWLVQKGSPESKKPATRAPTATSSNSSADSRDRDLHAGRRPPDGASRCTPTPC